MKHPTWTSHFVTGRIFIVDTVLPIIESDLNEEEVIIEHCENIYEEMWKISINNPENYLYLISV